MDPYSEQRLRNEVIFLHALWHQGPPSTRPPYPNPYPLQVPPSTRPPYPNPYPLQGLPYPNANPYPLPPSSSTSFKKTKDIQRWNIKHSGIECHHGPPQPLSSSQSRRRRRHRKRIRDQQQQPPPRPKDSGIEWPCPPVVTDPSPEGPSEWPSFTKTGCPDAHLPPPSPERQARFIANRSQFKALNAVTQFFKSMNSDSDSDESMDDADDDEDEGGGDEGSEGSGSGFFWKLFVEDGGLREYYEKNYYDGEFSCLVCGGVGKNKKFRDCLALVQHTVTISKTKKRKEHREYGQVVCKVLGWDIDKLPAIVSMISEKRNGCTSKLGEGEGEAQASLDNGGKGIERNVASNVDAVDGNNDEGTQGNECIDVEQSHDKIEGTESESTLLASVSNGSAEDLSKEVAEGVGKNMESVLTCTANVDNGIKDIESNVVDNVDSVNDNDTQKDLE